MRLSKRRRTASLDAMDVATRFVNAANQHDADSLIACVHRDFPSIQPVHPDRNFRGVGQLRNNWEAIFRSEPGFRLTVLRATATDDTVWMEVHGAGDDEEAAGTFILGVENGRIRWVRVYSDIVQAPPEIPVEVPEPTHAAVPDIPSPEAHPAKDAPSPAPDEDEKWDAVVTEGSSTIAVADLEEQPLAAREDTVEDAGELEMSEDTPESGIRKRRWRRLRGKAKS